MALPYLRLNKLALLTALVTSTLTAASAQGSNVCEAVFSQKPLQTLIKLADQEVKSLEPQTITSIESVRILSADVKERQSYIERSLTKDFYLERLSPAERTKLAQELLDSNNEKRGAAQIIKRFLVAKNSASLGLVAVKVDMATIDVLESIRIVDLPYAAALGSIKRTIDKDAELKNLSAEKKAALAESLLKFENNDVDSLSLIQRVTAARLTAKLKNSQVLSELRESEIHYEAAKMRMKEELSKELSLQTLNDKQRTELADELLDFKNSRRSTEAVVDSFVNALRKKTQAREELQKLAKDFFANETQLAETEKASILRYIEDSVLADPLFQKDPVNYLETSIAERGSIESLLMPQDPAMKFIYKLSKRGLLADLANKAKVAKLEADPSEFHSKDWNKPKAAEPATTQPPVKVEAPVAKAAPQDNRASLVPEKLALELMSIAKEYQASNDGFFDVLTAGHHAATEKFVALTARSGFFRRADIDQGALSELKYRWKNAQTVEQAKEILGNLLKISE